MVIVLSEILVCITNLGIISHILTKPSSSIVIANTIATCMSKISMCTIDTSTKSTIKNSTRTNSPSTNIKDYYNEYEYY